MTLSRKSLPKELTSYDLLKALAVLLMVCYSVGRVFYPDEMWLRVPGELGLPIWFFLIGYAKNDDVPKSFWLGAGIVFVLSLVSGQYVLPLNILFTLAIFRFCRAFVVRYGLYSAESLRGMFFILLLSSFPSGVFLEYGTLGLLMVLVGFMARRKESLYEHIEKKYVLLYVGAAFFFFYLFQGIQMPYLTWMQMLVLTLGYVCMALVLWRFEPIVFTDARKIMAGSFIKLFQFMGRYTLEIYVVQMILLYGAGMYLFPERFSFWAWKGINPEVLTIFISH